MPLPYTDEDLIIAAIVAASDRNHTDLLAVQTSAHTDYLALSAQLTAFQTSIETRLDTIIARLDTIIARLNTIIARLDTIILRLIDILNKLEEIRVFHQRYIAERRLPRTSAATILMSELFGNEDLDDDSDSAIYGKDFVIAPNDPQIPPLLGGTTAVDEFGDSIFPIHSGAATKTWQEYLDTIEEESYHP